MHTMHVFLLVSIAATAVASIYDLRTGRIPNWLTLGLLAAAPIGHFVCAWTRVGPGAGAVALGSSVAGAAVCGLVPLLCWRAGGFGGGDVKLLAAVGALCLPRAGIEIEFYATMAGLIVAMGQLAWGGRLLRTVAGSVAILLNPLLPRARRHALPAAATTAMRFAPAIFAGVALFVLLHHAR